MICSKLIALFALQQGATAFIAPGPSTLNNGNAGALFAANSYLGNLGNSPNPSDTTTSSLKSSVSEPMTSGPAVRSPAPSSKMSRVESNRERWESVTPVKVQGNTLRTWSFATASINRVEVLLKTDGRPMNADVDLWQGPDNTPQKMRIYIEDGSLRPFRAVLESPRGTNAIAIRNTGHLEFPIDAAVEADTQDAEVSEMSSIQRNLAESGPGRTVQGGALHTYPFAPQVASIAVLIRTDGRPLNARIELLQGPNNNKQVMEVYTEDGLERPFFAIIETPGTGNVVRIVNTGTIEYPMSAIVEPYAIDDDSGMFVTSETQLNGGNDNFFFLGR